MKALSAGFNVEIDDVNEIGPKDRTRTARPFLRTAGMHQCLVFTYASKRASQLVKKLRAAIFK